MFAGPRKARSPGEHLLAPVNSASRAIFCGVVCVILASVTALSARHSLRPARLLPDAVSEPRVRQALAQLGINTTTITDEQVRISEIPAPPFREAARGVYDRWTPIIGTELVDAAQAEISARRSSH